MKFKHLIGVAGLYLTLTAGAYAVPTYDYDSGQIVGVSGLGVDGELWDLTLLGGSYDAITGGGNEIIVSQAFAEAASLAFFNFYVSDPVTTDSFLGCDNTSCLIGTVYEDSEPSELHPWTVWIDQSHMHDSPVDVVVVYDINSSVDYVNWLYASWENPSPVPEPSIAILMASGLILLGVVRRKTRM